MTLDLTDTERELLDDMRRLGGFRTDEDTVKAALWSFARVLSVDVPIESFTPAPPKRTKRSRY